MIDQLSSSNSNSTQDMSLLQFKEFKVENFSTISMDLFRSKCSQCSQCSEYLPAKQIRIDTQRFHHYSDPNSFGGATLDTTTLDCGWLRQFLLAFSWRKNYEILFSASPKDCISEPIEISGLRVFALLWILMVHVCTVLYFVSGEILSTIQSHFLWNFINIEIGFSDNKMYKMRHGFNVVQEFIAHGILAFDFHFFLWWVTHKLVQPPIEKFLRDFCFRISVEFALHTCFLSGSNESMSIGYVHVLIHLCTLL